MSLQGDATFRLRLTDGALTARESELINETLGPLGLVIRSGQAYVSGMDLPEEPIEMYEAHGASGFVALVPAEYNLFVHERDLEAVPEVERKGLTDFVIELQRRLEPFPGVLAEPQFTGGRAMERMLADLEG